MAPLIEHGGSPGEHTKLGKQRYGTVSSRVMTWVAEGEALGHENKQSDASAGALARQLPGKVPSVPTWRHAERDTRRASVAHLATAPAMLGRPGAAPVAPGVRGSCTRTRHEVPAGGGEAGGEGGEGRGTDLESGGWTWAAVKGRGGG